jgi:DNA invertase Pin-like site-specific DNA recombinase
MTRTAVIYTRISLDRLGESESPERQEAECRDLVKRRGWDIAEVYGDRDTSAYKKKVRRPAYDRALRDLRDGRADVLLVFKLDRLLRRITAAGQVLEVLDDSGAELVSVTEAIDTSTPMGKAVMMVLAAVGEQESLNISTRVKLAQHHAAKNGRAHHGGRRKFGRNADGTIHEAEAEVVRDLVRRVLAGESFRGLAQALNEAQVKTSSGGPWNHTSVASVVRAPHVAGLRVVDGAEVTTDAEPIITAEERRELLAVLARPRRDRTGDQPKLLAGVIRCGECRVAMKHLRHPNGFARYVCVRGPGSGACGRVAVTLNGVERHVVRELLGLLARCRLRPLEGEDDEAQLEVDLAEAKTALTELVRERFVRRTITDADFTAARVELAAEVERLESRLEALRRGREQRQRAVPLGDRDTLEAWWRDADDSERRATVRWALSSVDVVPARVKGGGRFQTDRVKLQPNWSLLMLAADRATPTPEAETAYLDQAFEETQRSLDAEA